MLVELANQLEPGGVWSSTLLDSGTTACLGRTLDVLLCSDILSKIRSLIVCHIADAELLLNSNT